MPWNARSTPRPPSTSPASGPTPSSTARNPSRRTPGRRVRIGEVDFRVSGLCDRCAATIWDPVTQDRGKEPLRTLAKHRRWDGETWFGIRLVPRNLGELRVGDEVRPG
ncbi:MOSC domain-containing protein [Streptosporangium amethystogenes subsp. fukuiense]|uniref:MOSC domain-containing protein n=1 Tax=Streptosporangium amethystogenes TaxID=2002 RepID=UPI00361C1092